MALNLGNLNEDTGGLKLNTYSKKKKINITDNNIASEPKINSTSVSLPTKKTGGLSFPTQDVNKNLKVFGEKDTSSSLSFPTLKQIGGTALNTAIEIGKGITDFGEGIVDVGFQIGSSKYNPFMHLLYKGDVESGQEIAKELVSKDMSQNFIDNTLGYNKVQSNGKTIQENLDNNSLIKSNNLGGQVARSIGNMLPSVMVGNAGAGQTGSTLLMGLNSYGSGIDNAYREGATRNQANLYGIGNAALETATEWITGGVPGVQALKKIGLDNLANKGIEKINNSVIKELTRYGYKIVGEGFEEALAETLNPYLKNATYSKGNKVNWDDVMQSFIVGAVSGGILEAPSNINNINNAIRNQNKNVLPASNDIKIQSETVHTSTNEKQTSNDISLLQNSQNNTAINPNIKLPQAKYQYQSSDNRKINNLRQSAVLANFNNSEQTNNYINMLEKIIADKNVEIRFELNLTDSQGRIANGKYENGIITINPNSTRAGEFIAVHELTHAIGTDSMRKIVQNYRESNPQFESSLQSILKNYNTNELTEEAMSDVAGQLFGNQEFINNLSMENPNLFKRIYNEIKYLWHQFTGYKNQNQFIEDLQYKWEQAYRSSNELNNTNNLAIKQNSKGSYVQADRQVITGNNPKLWQQQVENYINDSIRNNKDVNVIAQDGDILTITKNTAGKAKFRNEVTMADGTKRKLNDNELFTKLTAETHIDELAEVSKRGKKIVPDLKNHSFAKDGFNYRTAYFEDYNGDYYKITMSVGKNGNINTIYNIGKMQNMAQKNGSTTLMAQRPNSASVANNVPQNTRNVNSGTSSTKYSMQESTNNTQELDNSSFSFKQKQLEIIQNNNPAEDDYHTWIRNIDDIKTFDETLEDIDYKEYYEAGEDFDETYSADMAKEALATGKITVYSSYPIEQGIFVSPSRMEASQYAGGDINKLYSKEVNLSDVAWIDPTQGQYAKVQTSDTNIRYSKQNQTWQEYLEDNFKATGTRTYLDDIKSLSKKEINMPKIEKNTSKTIKLPDKEYLQRQLEQLQKIDTKGMKKADREFLQQEINDRKEKLNIPLDPTKESSYDVDSKKTRKQVQDEYAKETDLYNINFDDAKNISKVMMNRNTPIRLNEKIFGKQVGSQVNEKFFYPIKDSESERIRFLNSERDDIKSLDIKPRSKESEAVQKWGEKKYVNDSGEVVPYSEAMLIRDIPDDNRRAKVKKAAQVIRNKYDNYLKNINSILEKNGYDPIPAREDYFMHFEELNDLFSQIGIPTKVNDLPTDINGVTDEFRPGKQFFANAMHREGMKTTYDAITGIDRYLESSSNILYHTDDIQRLRTLEKYLRDTYGKQNGLSEYADLTKEELIPIKDEYNRRIEKINSNHLSEYVSWLQEYTNVLAGKKSKMDRSIESLFGRKIYKYLQFGKKQVGSNMTGFNIGSALTNFISGTQGIAKTNKTAFFKGTIDTVKNIFKNDGFVNKSNFLTTRFGSDSISKTAWQKLSNAGQVFMSATDYFTANQIVRGKYYEYIQKGYSDSEAIKQADRFADRLMAGRGKGDMPNIFNSQMLGLVTQFQLEVNNQMDSMFYDTFHEEYAKDSNSILAKTSPSTYNAIGATFILGQLMAFAFLFNNEYEKIVGRRPAFDVINMLLEAFDGLEDEDKTIGDVAGNFFDELVDNLPFVSTFTGGGRIPLSSAIPNMEAVLKGDSNLGTELKKPLTYLLPPTGGGQVKKTIEGFSMYSSDKDIKGSYTSSGKLRFPVKEDTTSKVQAALFGQYASEEARNYFENGYLPLTEKQQADYKKLNVSIKEFREYRKYLSDVMEIKADKDSNGKSINGSASGKRAFKIMNSDITDKEKNYLLSSISNTDTPVTVSELKKIGQDEEVYKYYYSLDRDGKNELLKVIKELDMPTTKYVKTMKKISTIKSNENYTNNKIKEEIIKTVMNTNLKDDQKAYIYQKYYSSEKTLDIILNSKIPINSYLELELNTIGMEADEDIKSNKEGATVSGSKKKKVLKEIAQISNTTVTQKLLLTYLKGYSINTGDFKGISENSARKDVFNYINNLNLTAEEKRKIYSKTGYTVYKNGRVGW